MRILVILPAAERLVSAGEVEARRRQLALRASPDTELEMGFVDQHSVWQEKPSLRDFEILAPYMAKRAREAEEQGFDAVMIHCAADPGLQEAREICSIPVVGPGQAVLAVAPLMCRRLAVIHPHDAVVDRIWELVDRYHVRYLVHSVQGLNLPVNRLVADNKEAMRERFMALGREAVAKGADAIFPKGLAIPTHVPMDQAQAELGVPILDGVGITLGLTEMLARLRLRSRAASAA